MKRITALFMAIMLAAMLGGCKKTEESLQTYALGTICTQTVYDGDTSVMKSSEQILYDIDARMSRYRDGSEIDAVNESADFVKISEDTEYVIKTAQQVSELSEGAFDISMGILSAEWDIVNNPHVPTAEKIAADLAQVGYEKIVLENGEIKTPEGMIIDLGGIAKGYAADALAKKYREAGVKSALINLGGNIYAIGNKPDGSKFLIGIADPDNSTDYFAVIEIADTALVTSGAYERNFTAPDGTFYHHILDPKTGYPADSGVISVSILSDNSTLADALSTAVYILGADKGIELLESIPNADGIIVRNDKTVVCTKGFLEKYSLKITNSKYKLED